MDHKRQMSVALNYLFISMNYNPEAHRELKDEVALKPFCGFVSYTERRTETKGTASSGGTHL